jgi:hypothetical protein
VRGDYLRDLYAKTLALVGLGVLAASGALLDYWPAGIVVPMPSHPALPVATEHSRTPRVEVSMPDVVASSRPSSPTPKSSRTPMELTFAPLATATAAGPIGTSVALASDVFMLAPEESHVVAQPTLIDAEFGGPSPSAEQARADAFVAEDDESGLVTLAFRKTGSSIAKTGAKAGSSIVGAMRGLSGAVRKALPAI